MIPYLLDRWADETPGAPLIVTDSGTHSFAAVRALARRFANRLRQQGVGAGQHVALIAGNSAAYLVAWLGINGAGAVAVTLNNKLKGDAISQLIERSDSVLVIADEQWIADIAPELRGSASALERIAISEDAAFFADIEGVEDSGWTQRNPQDLCTILYTSGTTGLPKGVMCTHAGYEATGHATAGLLALTPLDRTLIFLPLFHTNPQNYGVMSALSIGCSVALLPRFSASNFFSDAKRLEATGLTFVGTVLNILVARHEVPQRAHRLRYAIGGGTNKALCETIEYRFGFSIHELYGMTEIGGWVSGNSKGDRRLGSCGLVRDDFDVRIFDKDDNEVETGGQGEIVVRPRMPSVMFSGYLGQPEQTLAACRNLWFHTGDLGRFDADGFLYFIGRLKEVIRRGGEMISPAEIEHHLRKMLGVLDCAVVGVPDPIMEEEIKAVVVAEGVMTPSAVTAFLGANLPHFMLPRYVEFVTVIPRTETEKILRRELQYVSDAVVDLRHGLAAADEEAPKEKAKLR